MIEHAGELVTKEKLLNAVWAGTVVTDAALTTCIREIRRRLGEEARRPQYIETVHRRGYRWIAPPAPATQSLRWAKAYRPTQHAAFLMVGRAREFDHLQHRLEQAQKGERQIVFVTGEAGIGKTTLVDAWLKHVGTTVTIWSARGQCIEHQGAGEAYLPVLEALGRLYRQPGQQRFTGLLRKYAPTWLAQLPWLLNPDARAALQREVLTSTRERMLREIAEALEALTAETPLVLVLEDLHWSDDATLDFLSSLARRREAARLLVIGTYRPLDVLVRESPLHSLTQELELQGRCTALPLEGLTEAEISAYLAERFPRYALSPALARVLHQRTDGNPLFLINVVAALVTQGVLGQSKNAWERAAELEAVERGLPESLRQMIERQIARLSPEDQRVLEVASVVGVEFPVAAVAAGLAFAEEEIEDRCAALARQQNFLLNCGRSDWPDGTLTARYAFLHTLYRDVWYERLTEKRRIDLHRCVGARLETGYGTRAGTIAAALAVHFLEGRDHERAVLYLRQAADNAGLRHAYAETLALLTQGLQLLRQVPATPARWRHELSLQLRLSHVLMAIKGYGAPEVEAALTRALALSDQIADARYRIRVVLALAGFYTFRGDLQKAQTHAAQGLALGQQTQQLSALLWAHYQLGVISLIFGEFTVARRHLAEAMTLYGRQSPGTHTYRGVDDPGVRCRVDGGLVLWCLGYPEEALQQSREGLVLAQKLEYPLTLASAWHLSGMLHQLRGERAIARQHADALLTLATAHGISVPRVAGGLMLRGWTVAAQDDRAEGLAQIQQGLTRWESAGSRLLRPYALATLAEVHLQAGQAAEGLALVREALALANTTGERWYAAELHRLEGELTLVQSDIPDRERQAESSWRTALDIACRQQAKSWELRTATSLARLWQRQGKRREAYELLAPIYGWFIEGHDTADLQKAKSVLDDLS